MAGPEAPVKRQLTDEAVFVYIACGHVFVLLQHADRHRKVKVRAALLFIAWRQADDDALFRKDIAGFIDGGLHALGRLPDRLVAEPDDRNGGLSLQGFGFNIHRVSVDTVDGKAFYHGSHSSFSPICFRIPSSSK